MSAGLRCRSASSATASCSTAARRCRSRSATSSIPFALADAYGVDQLRYFFLREVPFGQDGNYSHEAIVNRINADLANDLGNLAQRSLSMIAKNCGGACRRPAISRRRTAIFSGCADALPAKARAAMYEFALHHRARRDLGSRRGGEPLFRGAGAVGAAQGRSGADGDGALRDRGGPAHDRHPGAALRSGFGGKASRPSRRAGGRGTLAAAGPLSEGGAALGRSRASRAEAARAFASFSFPRPHPRNPGPPGRGLEDAQGTREAPDARRRAMAFPSLLSILRDGSDLRSGPPQVRG